MFSVAVRSKTIYIYKNVDKLQSAEKACEDMDGTDAVFTMQKYAEVLNKAKLQLMRMITLRTRWSIMPIRWENK